MKRKLPEKFFEQNQRDKTRKWKLFNLNHALWGTCNREFRRVDIFCIERSYGPESDMELGRGRGISNLDKKARITRPAPLI